MPDGEYHLYPRDLASNQAVQFPLWPLLKQEVWTNDDYAEFRVSEASVYRSAQTVKGTVIGRGVPGYIFSEDFVMRDDTGIIFLDFRQPLAIWEWMFGLLKAGEYQGREVVVEGWYRRAPVPYIELKSIEMGGDVTRSWVPLMNKLTAIAIIAAGAAWAGYAALGLA